MIACNTEAQEYKCQMCGLEQVILIDKKDFTDWKEGKGYIQDLFHYLTAAEREMMISQICDNCWNTLYGEI